MYEKDDNQEFYPEANNCEFFENKKLKIEKSNQIITFNKIETLTEHISYLSHFLLS